ncbi:MAG: sporulation protein YunB [Clostridiaceae bacterium]|nr:sporulation protein YunB [Clostridiaceae bacterium]
MKAPNFRLRALAPRVFRRTVAFCLIILLAFSGWLLWRQIDQTLRDYAAIWCGDLAARAVNAAVLSELKDAPSLAALHTDDTGHITAIELDGAAASRLKAAVALCVSDNLTALEQSGGEVPLGTLLGSRLFMGRGPRFRFQMMPVGNAQTEILSRFVEAGVNQTTWQLVLTVDITVGVMLPGAVIYRNAGQEAILCETVIVGEVPMVYAKAE